MEEGQNTEASMAASEQDREWFKRHPEYYSDGTPLYGDRDDHMKDFYTIQMETIGHFEYRPHKVFLSCGMAWFDFVDPVKTKYKDLLKMLLDFGWTQEMLDGITFYQRVSSSEFEDGFRLIRTDDDVLGIPKYIKQGERKAYLCADNGSGPDMDKGGSSVQAVCEEIKEEVMSEEESESDPITDHEYDSALDDLDYEANVHKGAEYGGVCEAAKRKGKAKMSDNSESGYGVGVGQSVPVDDLNYNSEDGLDGYHSDMEDPRPKGPIFNPKKDLKDPQFELMMQFEDAKIFKKAVKWHAIKKGKPIEFLFQTYYKVKAVCKHPCEWSVYASRCHGESHLVIKRLNTEHSNCSRVYKSKFIDASWIAENYINVWREDPTAGAATLKKKIWEDYTMNVSKFQVYRTREKALNMINENVEVQYGQLWDYGEELKRRNPGSTVTMKLADGSLERGDPTFERFYVCLAGLKKGFKNCRRILSVDGCFLKGKYGGQLLAASGIDPNNNWFPVAYAVVESESYNSWYWFMSQLIDDLELNDDGLTIMSDKQKGLVDFVKNLLPMAEHRFCVMHMLANMRFAGFKGLTYKELLWNAARATTPSRFKHWMEQTAEHDIKASI